MQKYIDQLLEDIAAAHRPEGEVPPEDKSFSIEQHFEEVERWLESDPAYTFAYYCGLQPEQFPPAERLTIKQLHTIYKAFGQLLFSWNLDADIPKSFPVRRAYSLLISTLHHKVEIVNDGFITIEFCTCDPPSCPFEEYCSCKKYEKGADEINMNADEENDQLPF
jgi:hypothetical protein